LEAIWVHGGAGNLIHQDPRNKAPHDPSGWQFVGVFAIAAGFAPGFGCYPGFAQGAGQFAFQKASTRPVISHIRGHLLGGRSGTGVLGAEN